MGNLNDNLFSLENFNKVLSGDMQLNEAAINHSGNSDVDISIQLDTTPIAFAMLCSLLATKQLSNEEFELAVRKLEDLTKNKKIQPIKEANDISKVNLFNHRRRRR
jgi:hypothetical protein